MPRFQLRHGCSSPCFQVPQKCLNCGVAGGEEPRKRRHEIADRMIKIDFRRHLDSEMAAAVAESQRLQDEIVAERGAIAPDDLAGRRAAYEHERAFWNSLKPELFAIDELSIPGLGG